MRCFACNCILTPQESVRRFKESRECVDLCSGCLTTVQDEVEIVEGRVPKQYLDEDEVEGDDYGS